MNASETLLTPTNVNVNQFGKRFSTPLDGQVYAQPLFVPGVNITTGTRQGVHDVAYVATEHDSLYAIDSDSGGVLWKDSFINPSQGVTSVPSGDTGSGDISPEIGITATPVIDAATQTLYLTAKTKEVRSGVTHYVYRLHAINLADGSEKLGGPVVIGDTAFNGGYTNTTPIFVNGTGDGSSNGKVYFNALRAMNRPGLTLANGQLYIAFASHGDNGPYHGWVVGYNPTTLQLSAVFNATPNGGLGGIWQAGGVTAVDPQGYLYFETGNGTFDTTLNSAGFPSKGNYGDSFVKLGVDTTTNPSKQNINGWGLKVVDYFTPFNQAALNSVDRDLGSGAPIVLPDSVGSATHPHLLLGSGKEGKIYLIDRDNMGKFSPSTDRVVQTQGNAINGSLDTPAFFNNTIYYVGGYGDVAKTFSISGGKFSSTAISSSTDSYGFPGSTPSISADGSTNGVVWTLDRSSNQLRAYEASTGFAHRLWTSAQAANGRDQLGSVVKFSVPMVAEGRVFVGTSNALVVYGPPIAPTSKPAAPTNLTATAQSGVKIALAWTDNSDNEDGFRLERSTDGVNFTVLATLGVNETSYGDSSIEPTTHYYYRVRAYNVLGDSDFSNVADATSGAAGTPAHVYHFDEGSGTTTNDSADKNPGTFTQTGAPTWVAPGRVGSAALSFGGAGGVVTSRDLSTDLGGTATLTAWIKTRQVGNNTAWQAPAITGVENQASGNDVFWGFIDAAGHIGIQAGDGAGALSTSIVNNGLWHHVAFTRDSATGVMRVYVDGNLQRTVTGDAGAKTSQFRLLGGLTTVDGGGVNQTGAIYFNGQIDEVQIYPDVLSSNQIATLGKVAPAPTGLTVTPASGTQLNLSWSDNSSNELGFKIERSTDDIEFVQVDTVGANVTTYEDSALDPNIHYYYRVRATNAAGDSAYSNLADAITPVPPLTPTDMFLDYASSTEVHFTWTDRADNEVGYKILRKKASDSQFSEIANLPANSHDFLDKNVQPGTEYDYHVQAYNVAGYSDFAGIKLTTPANDGSTRVLGRALFYNNSAFDNHDPAATPNDLAAVAPDKTALRQVGGEDPADFGSVSSYASGINGLLITFAGMPPALLTASDFVFRVGHGGNPATWALAPVPAAVTQIPTPTGGNSAVYAVTWDDGAIRNEWLQITVKAGSDTGLPADDVFYFGNLIGETGDTAALSVSAGDLVRTRNLLGSSQAAIDNLFDFNRDGQIGASDLVLCRNAVGHTLANIGAPAPALRSTWSGAESLFGRNPIRPRSRDAVDDLLQ